MRKVRTLDTAVDTAVVTAVDTAGVFLTRCGRGCASGAEPWTAALCVEGNAKLLWFMIERQLWYHRDDCQLQQNHHRRRHFLQMPQAAPSPTANPLQSCYSDGDLMPWLDCIAGIVSLTGFTALMHMC